ncbi:MAG: BMP family ABC transporter substrate-binding protein, partial [Candidatus Eremiobacteraeota bacterium]|nr:BMP family ABC transporter substrate-binding protein [Candidatus Eremiobacteraeota bacterium]
MLVRAAIWSIVFPLCFALGGCSRKPPALPAVKIGLVVDVRGFSDRSFNARALAALTQCRRRTGVGIDAQAPQTAADYGPKLVLLATQNYDTVIAMGPSMAHDVSEAARRFANTHFALIGAVVDEPNVNSITFKEQDGSFLAGALAAMVSKTKSVAFLGGADVPQLEPSLAGFEAGVRQVDARVRVRVRYLGSFDDTSAAHGAAGALYREGSDIIYTVAGRSG